MGNLLKWLTTWAIFIARQLSYKLHSVHRMMFADDNEVSFI